MVTFTKAELDQVPPGAPPSAATLAIRKRVLEWLVAPPHRDGFKRVFFRGRWTYKKVD